MLTILKTLMILIGASGIVWYTFSPQELWPVLAYFSVLLAVGVVSIIGYYIKTHSYQKLVVGVNYLAIALLVAMQFSAFAISPGSGVAAIPFIGVPIAISLASIRATRSH